MNIIISNSSSDPIYEQIVRQIKEDIIKGNLQAGEALPSIRSLAKELQISVITTKRAYEKLENEGFIETIGGKGSYVAGQNLELLREKKLKMIEDKMLEVIIESRTLGIDLVELETMLKYLYEEV